MKALLISFIFCVFFASTGYSTIIQGGGIKYPVAEKSLRKIFMTNLRQEAGRHENNPQARQYIVSLSEELQVATKDSTRQIDITYTLPFDIVDDKNQVLFPEGTRINPLQYAQIPVLIVVTDSEDHIRWAMRKQKEMERKSMILLSKGSFQDIFKKYKLKVYHLNDQIIARFQIRCVPCIIHQTGALVDIHEYAL